MTNKEIIKVILASLGKAGFAKKLNISIYKLNNKINQPDLFTVAEWVKIEQIYKEVKELPVK